ncbi:nitrous oxide reductase accessory protein NosL [Lysobacter panacisoli]|uniref:Nitrous oxide reductase accessory protein NosL n=1 Tax=Lysobacter panacisoli TaxID=1255263 RepID=A0ABP9L897_9GAMM|nr:nitrous oxide reductase accessory protein NosL [Lysobacter panacisoli]
MTLRSNGRARLRRLVALALPALLLSACGERTSVTTAPIEPRAGEICELDGMTLADFPGPKGQIRYADGKTSYFCDTVELLSVVLMPEQVRKVDGAYTQDMARANWETPAGHWIRVEDAFYVEGSRRVGSMGPTLASFALRADAEVFARKFGGKVLPFSEITPNQVRLDGGTTHDQGM